MPTEPADKLTELKRCYARSATVEGELNWFTLEASTDTSPSLSNVKKNRLFFSNLALQTSNDIHTKVVQKTLTTPQTIQQVHDMVLDDLREKVGVISEVTGTSKQVLCMMGAAFANNFPKTHTNAYFLSVSGSS
ncbi:hypothetical protein Trydic_g21419 [Trypoxylus dichotomus]